VILFWESSKTSVKELPDLWQDQLDPQDIFRDVVVWFKRTRGASLGKKGRPAAGAARLQMPWHWQSKGDGYGKKHAGVFLT
jgi:hypothetical protein